MTETTRKEWLVNMYQSKLFAFITSGWLAVCVIAILLAIVYVMLKVSKEAPIVEAPAVVEQVVTPAIKKAATKAINTKVIPEAGITVTDLKPVKPVEPETQFDRDLANFEKRIPQ